jgi:hypothetical protein
MVNVPEPVPAAGLTVIQPSETEAVQESSLGVIVTVSTREPPVFGAENVVDGDNVTDGGGNSAVIV